jgi:O-antigen ligase
VALTLGPALSLSALIVEWGPLVTMAALIAVPGLLILAVFPVPGLVFYVSSLGFIDPLAAAIGLPLGLRAFPFAITLTLVLVTHAVVTGKAIRLTFMHMGPLAILALMTFGMFWTPAPNYGLWKIQAYLQYNLLAFLGTALFVGDRKSLERFVYTAAWLSVPLMVAVSLSLLQGGGATWQRYGVFGFTALPLSRAMGFFAVTLLIMSRVTGSRYVKIACIATIPYSVFVIVLTGSRMPLFGLLITALFYLTVIEKASATRRAALVVAFIAISYVMFQLAPEEARTRYTNLFSDADAETNSKFETSRARLYEVSVSAIKDYPVFGLGTGGFAWYYTGVDHGGYPHNLFFEILTEFGTLGLIAMAVFFGPCVRIIWQLARKGQGVTRDNFPVCWGAVVLVLGFLNAQTSFDIAGNHIVWFAAAYLQAAASTPRRAQASAARGAVPVVSP